MVCVPQDSSSRDPWQKNLLAALLLQDVFQDSWSQKHAGCHHIQLSSWALPVGGVPASGGSGRRMRIQGSLNTFEVQGHIVTCSPLKPS